jgi:hypothetical protein
MCFSHQHFVTAQYAPNHYTDALAVVFQYDD